jgi:hypothetical protein
MNYANYWTKHHRELHHRKMCKEFLTPIIVLEMLQIEQQQQQAACAAQRVATTMALGEGVMILTSS